ncbi:hypothetical protein PP178_14230 [Zeaxanthinibacter sp. PT1]|uniref:hypothetical protein n=1 Tax=Zeaxanthinibacter TaxID=561554 RepID=UPI00234971D1|nr:hypothetical protein [Zeaxanthinibacter sp. PT1]MDC6352715.1 hypothetical protein [Zeaxanthinibacter sp. PT1]
METGIIIISLVLVGSVFIPYYFLESNGRASRKQWQVTYHKAVNAHQLNIIMEEAWEQNYIGIDDQLKKLLFIKSYDSVKTDTVIDLNNLSQCKVIEVRKYPRVKDKKTEILERVDLELSFHHEENKLFLNLYDNKINFSQDYEIRRAEKWRQIISKHIRSYQRGNRVA